MEWELTRRGWLVILLWLLHFEYPYHLSLPWLLTRNREGTSGRALTNGLDVPGGKNNMTVANCVSTCQAAGYLLAGVKYSGECCQLIYTFFLYIITSRQRL